MNEVETGYVVTEPEEKKTPRGNYYCDYCDSSNLEFQRYCTWNNVEQEWVLGDDTEEEPYCSECEDRVNYNWRNT